MIPLNRSGKPHSKTSNTTAILNNNADNSHLFGHDAQDTVQQMTRDPRRVVEMSKVFKFGVIGAALVIVAAQGAFAKPAIKDVQKISDSFVQLGIADEIRKNCDSISPRLMRAYNYVQNVKTYAESLGYSDAEIEAYADSDSEKKRLLGIAYTYMQANGVVKGKSETFCALGRAEIAKGSAAGRLLKAK